MPKEISIAFDMPNASHVRQLSELLEDVPDLRLMGEINGRDLSITPEVIFIGGDGLAFRLEALKRKMPGVKLFAVSKDQSPENIVTAMQSGAAEFITEPVRLDMLLAAFERVRTKMAGDDPRTEGKVLSFVSSKGGLGATVITVNTAVAMAARDNCRVAIIDLSLHAGDSAVMLDMLPTTTMADVCRNLHRMDYTLLEDAFARHNSGVWYLPAPRNPEEVDEVTGEQVWRVLDMAKGLFDYILVDCASMGSEECSREAFKTSERIFVLTDLSVSSIRNAARLTRMIRHHGAAGEKIEVVLNRYLKGSVLSIDEIERTLGRKMYWLFPNDFSRVITSINDGQPFVQQQPTALLSKNVAQFAGKILDPASAGDYRGAKGFLGKQL